tara:strand:+ start:69 stop:353 length:285 start_codon:yes stop_codon:yes gene_type:complete
MNNVELAIRALEEAGYIVTIRKRRAFKDNNLENEIYDYNISVRSARVLSSIGIASPEDLIESNIGYSDLHQVAGCGKKTTCEIVDYINRLRDKE